MYYSSVNFTKMVAFLLKAISVYFMVIEGVLASAHPSLGIRNCEEKNC